MTFFLQLYLDAERGGNFIGDIAIDDLSFGPGCANRSFYQPDRIRKIFITGFCSFSTQVRCHIILWHLAHLVPLYCGNGHSTGSFYHTLPIGPIGNLTRNGSNSLTFSSDCCSHATHVSLALYRSGRSTLILLTKRTAVTAYSFAFRVQIATQCL